MLQICVGCLFMLLPYTAHQLPLLRLRLEPVRTYYVGKVVSLKTLLEQKRLKVDPDAASNALVLQTDEGKVYTVLKDEGSRMLFLDDELHNRPLQLSGRLISGSQILQITRVETVVKGVPHEVFYWCETCQLRYTEPGNCKCCNEPVVRREVPIK